ncbi:unnamed protein product [Fusarium langsethiae]|nr:unnamed protein product [Fusarium langsethiae]
MNTRALVSCLAASASVFATPSAYSLSSLDARACSTPANSLKNPSFESSLTSWVFKPTYAKLGSADVVTGGYKSNHAVQLSWSMLLPKDGSKYTAPGIPRLYVEAQAPDGIWHQLGNFQFSSKTFSSTIFSPNKKGAHNIDQWANFVADFPTSQTGTWVISMEWHAQPASGKTTTLKFKMDDFTVTPKV